MDKAVKFRKVYNYKSNYALSQLVTARHVNIDCGRIAIWCTNSHVFHNLRATKTTIDREAVVHDDMDGIAHANYTEEKHFGQLFVFNCWVLVFV